MSESHKYGIPPEALDGEAKKDEAKAEHTNTAEEEERRREYLDKVRDDFPEIGIGLDGEIHERTLD